MNTDKPTNANPQDDSDEIPAELKNAPWWDAHEKAVNSPDAYRLLSTSLPNFSEKFNPVPLSPELEKKMFRLTEAQMEEAFPDK